MPEIASTNSNTIRDGTARFLSASVNAVTDAIGGAPSLVRLGRSDIREQHYEHYQVVCDGSAWICLAVRQCTGATTANNRPTPTIDPRVTRRSPAPIADTITAATTRHWGCCANPPAYTPITAVRIDIHNLQHQLRRAGHELPEFLRSGYSKSHGPSGCY
jgi:hypothetical protein